MGLISFNKGEKSEPSANYRDYARITALLRKYVLSALISKSACHLALHKWLTTRIICREAYDDLNSVLPKCSVGKYVQ